jgi:hypothetical protein
MIRQGSLSNTGWFLIVATALAAVLLVAGCGDGDDSSASGSAETSESTEITVESGSLSKAQFIEKADAVCEKGRKKFERLLGDFISSAEANESSSGQQAQAKALVNSVFAPIYEEQIDEISSLGAPSGDEDEVEAVLKAIQQDIDKGKEDPLKYVRSENIFAGSTKPARAYGFTYCPT